MMLSEDQCNQPFVECHNGFTISSENLFLQGKITIETPKEYSHEELWSAIGHFTAMHCILIHKDLPHFPGYGNLKFEMVDKA